MRSNRLTDRCVRVVLYNKNMSELPKLSPKHQVFVSKYLELWNATRAYMVAYPRASEDSARALAANLLANVNIRAHISVRLSEIHMSADEALQRLRDMATGDIGQFIDDDGVSLVDTDDAGNVTPKKGTRLIKRLKTKKIPTIHGDIQETEIELYDAQSAIEKILRVSGKFSQGDKAPVGDVSFVLPADLLGPAFFWSWRALRGYKYIEFCEEGGRGSFKSSFAGYGVVSLIIDNPTGHVLCIRQVADSLRISSYAQVKWCIEILGLSEKFKFTLSPMEITYLPTGQKIYFSGADDPSKIKSIKPPFGYIMAVWFEEYDQMRGMEAVRTIEQSIRGGDRIIYLKTWNTPKTKAHWVVKEMAIPNPRRWHHRSTYLDIPPEWLGQAWLDQAEHLKNVNPKAYEHEYLGVSNGTGGMVFENVELRKITDEEISQFDHTMRGLDFGYFPDPLSFGLLHYDAARMIIYIYGEFRGHKLSNRKAWDALLEKKLTTTGDLIIADSAEPKSIADFRDYGANIRGAEKGPDSVDYSIKWLASRAKIVIDPERAPYHAQEFLEYELEQDKNGEFISAYPDKNNHAIDDVRYATNLIWRRKGQ
jgi:phage terminase large subunit